MNGTTPPISNISESDQARGSATGKEFLKYNRITIKSLLTAGHPISAVFRKLSTYLSKITPANLGAPQGCDLVVRD